MAEKLGFDPTNVAQVGDQAPTLITKLKSSGVTSVVLFADNALITPLTKAATDQEYSPEWIFTGYGYQDFDGFARTFDQDQMRHAFGLSVLSPYTADAPPYLDLFTWYWGKTQGNTWSITNGLFNAVYTYIQYAGPTLTAANVKKGLFSVPASGGAATGTIAGQTGYGKTVGLPFDEYALFGTDRALVWWNADITASSTSRQHRRQGRVHVHGRRKTPRLCRLLQVGAEVLRTGRSSGRSRDRCTVPRRRRLAGIALRDVPLEHRHGIARRHIGIESRHARGEL